MSICSCLFNKGITFEYDVGEGGRQGGARRRRFASRLFAVIRDGPSVWPAHGGK